MLRPLSRISFLLSYLPFPAHWNWFFPDLFLIFPYVRWRPAESNRSPCWSSETIDAGSRVECPLNRKRFQKHVLLRILTVSQTRNLINCLTSVTPLPRTCLKLPLSVVNKSNVNIKKCLLFTVLTWFCLQWTELCQELWASSFFVIWWLVYSTCVVNLCIQLVYSSCVFNLCIQVVYSTCVFNLCIQVVYSSCVFNLCIQLVYSTCVFDLCIQVVYSTCVFNLCIRLVYSTCVFDLCIRLVYSTCVFNLCIQLVYSTCVDEMWICDSPDGVTLCGFQDVTLWW